MTGAEQRVVDDPAIRRVNAPPLVARLRIEGRREQRVGEPNRPVLALDHVRGDGRVERVRRDARPLQERLRRRAQRRDERERLARGRRKRGDPRAHELVERLGNRQRLERVDVGVERAGQLQREERIAARPLVDAEQRLPREGPAEPVAQEPVDRADAERSHRQPPDALRAERLLEPRRLRPLDEPPGEQQAHVARVEPSQRERERARRGRVEPLDVVDGDQHRARARRAASARRAPPRRARGDRPGRPTPPRAAARPRAPAAAAAPARAARRRATPSNRSPSPAWARPRSASAGRARARAAPARGRARPRRARASTSRCPPRPPARARRPVPPHRPERRAGWRARPPC